LLDQIAGQPDKPGRIHVQESRCGSTYRRKPNDHTTVDREMNVPVVMPRVEQIRLLHRQWIDADQVRAFMIVAFAAGPCECLWFVRDFIEMLFGNDMVDVKYEIRHSALGKVAVFATLTRSSPN